MSSAIFFARLLLISGLLYAVCLPSAGTAQTDQKKTSAVEKNATSKARKKVLKADKPSVQLDGFEIVWPEIEGYDRFILEFRKGEETWRLEQTGSEPSFNAIEEEFEEGEYRFRISYMQQKFAKATAERREAFAKRRDLLKRRLELLEKGDRDAARKMMDQANEIRATQREKETLDVAKMLKQRRSASKRSITGVLTVDADKKVALSEKQSKAETREKRTRETTRID